MIEIIARKRTVSFSDNGFCVNRNGFRAGRGYGQIRVKSDVVN